MTTGPHRSGVRLREFLIAGSLLGVTAVLFVWATRVLPVDGVVFGYDWHNYWVMMQTGWPNYGLVDVFNPPWSLLMLWPLAQLPFRESWAVLTFMTLLVLVVTLPWSAGKKTALMAGLLLLTSFITLRHLADGNLGALVVGGGSLLVVGWRKQWPGCLALGVLLVTAKYQESWLLLLALGWYLWRAWSVRALGAAAALTLAVVGPSLWLLGEAWLARLIIAAPESTLGVKFASSIARPGGNISLNAFGEVLGAMPWLLGVLQLAVLGWTAYLVMRSRAELSSEKLGMLLTASMLLAPYAGGLSLLTALALGAGPLFTWQAIWAGGLIGLTHLPYLFIALNVSDVAPRWPEWYWTVVLLLIWGTCGWRVYSTEIAAQPAAPDYGLRS